MSKYETVNRGETLPVRSSAIFPVHAGKGFIVTGAASGIGAAIAELLLAQGAKVVLSDVDSEKLAARAAACGGEASGCRGIAINVGSESSAAAGVGESVAWLGRIDGLVNCAAILIHADPLDIPREDWRRQFEINLFGAYEMSRLVSKSMIGAKTRGAIVSIASEAGKKGHMESLAYSASKAGLINMTRMLSEALAVHDINVNCVCPGGGAATRVGEVFYGYSGITNEPASTIFDKMASKQLVRHIEPIEVARVVSFLLGDEAMLIRGQAVNADAGDTPY
jgi:NAD(P)-dependent dehydrogenase (short-subunit alcohol dehydrogenase family)